MTLETIATTPQPSRNSEESRRMDEPTMSFEQNSYEVEELWEAGALGPHDEARIRLVTSIIPESVRSVLDVGCGNGLFLNHLVDHHRDRFERICGLDRSAAALRHVRAEHVRGSLDALPFESASFHLTTCMEVLEHLPLNVYDVALSELARVSREYIIITVPNEEDLAISLSRCVSCGCAFNANYHLRSYNAARLRTMFSATHDCVKVFPLVDERVIPAALLRGVFYAKRAIGRSEQPAPAWAICPMCGYQRENGSHISGDTPVQSSPRLKARIARFLSFERRPRWLGALYARRTPARADR